MSQIGFQSMTGNNGQTSFADETTVFLKDRGTL